MSTTLSTTLQHNKELATIFRHMSDCYKYLGQNERFRAIAYDTASKTLSNMSEPVDIYGHDIKKLDQLKGVGERIAEKIIEYLDTGKIQTFEKLKQKVPYELLELMDIEGIGPASVRLLHDKLKANTKEDVVKAIEEGKLKDLRGFTVKKIADLKRVLKSGKNENKRMTLKVASRIAEEILNAIKKFPGIIRVEIAGSIRRKKETIGDVDIVITAKRQNWKRIISKFVRLPQVKRVIASGDTKASVLLKKDNVQVDLRIVHDDEYGAAMLYFTGSREHTIQLRTIAKKKGWKINEYGVFNSKTNKRLAGETEEGIYKLFGLNFIPPEKRIGKDELEGK